MLLTKEFPPINTHLKESPNFIKRLKARGQRKMQARLRQIKECHLLLKRARGITKSRGKHNASGELKENDVKNLPCLQHGV